MEGEIMNVHKLISAAKTRFYLIKFNDKGEACAAPHEWVELDDAIQLLAPELKKRADHWRRVSAARQEQQSGNV